MGYKHHISAVALMCIVALFGTGALLARGMVPAAEREPRFPPFTMTREITQDDGTWVYQFEYEDDLNWKLTLVSSPVPHTVLGANFVEELRDGENIVTIQGEIFSRSQAGREYVPGLWFVNEGWWTPRGTLNHHTLATENRGEHRVHALTNSHPELDSPERVTLTYHVETGIPVGYERHIGEELVESHRVTSLVLTATGEKLR